MIILGAAAKPPESDGLLHPLGRVLDCERHRTSVRSVFKSSCSKCGCVHTSPEKSAGSAWFNICFCVLGYGI